MDFLLLLLRRPARAQRAYAELLEGRLANAEAELDRLIVSYQRARAKIDRLEADAERRGRDLREARRRARGGVEA